jgi:hypothetical protein
MRVDVARGGPDVVPRDGDQERCRVRVTGMGRTRLMMVLLLVACGDDAGGSTTNGSGGATGSGGDATDAASTTDASTADAATTASGSSSGSTSGSGGVGAACDGMAEGCADTFGDLFTPSNGRADGTLLAVVGTTDAQCALHNDDHVVLEVTILGGVQRLVVNVDGVAVAAQSAPLVGPPFEEGWHEDVTLDYVDDLELHSDVFEQVTIEGAEAFLCEHLAVGEPISVFAYAEDNPSSAHQIHFNESYPDGVIVAGPTSASPTYLAFRFGDQDF